MGTGGQRELAPFGNHPGVRGPLQAAWGLAWARVPVPAPLSLCPLEGQLDRAGQGWSPEEPMPSAALASGGGGRRLDSVTEAGVRGHRGWGQPTGETERDREPPPEPRRTERREGWCRGPAGLVHAGVQAPGRGASPLSQTHGLWGWGSRGPQWQLQQAGAGWVRLGRSARHQAGRQEGGGPG